MANADEICIEVAYALPERAHLITLQVRSGTTIRQGIELSGMLQRCPEIDLAQNRVGIFGKLKELDTVLHGGDRIEIYRPLQVDPKEARRKRAEKNEDT